MNIISDRKNHRKWGAWQITVFHDNVGETQFLTYQYIGMFLINY